MARDLNALFKIANTINSIRDFEPLQQRLLQLIGEVLPADSGAIVILRHPDEEPAPAASGIAIPALNSQFQNSS